MLANFFQYTSYTVPVKIQESALGGKRFVRLFMLYQHDFQPKAICEFKKASF